MERDPRVPGRRARRARRASTRNLTELTARLLDRVAILRDHVHPTVADAPPRARCGLTLTCRMLERAGSVVWLAAGPEKAAQVERLMRGDVSIPAGRVGAPRNVVVLDAAAAAEVRYR